MATMTVETTAMPAGAEESKTPRRVYILKPDVKIHGATRGCPGCIAVIMKKKAQNHSEACRARFIKIFENSSQLLQTF